MVEIISKCRKHGPLDEDNAVKCADKNLPNGYRWRCKICRHENSVNLYYKNREKIIKYAGEWKKENRERVNAQTRANRHIDIEATREKEADKYKRKLEKNPDLVRITAICKKRKMNLDHYYQMVEDQKNLCAICGQEETRRNRSGEVTKRLSVDHCHKTDLIRGLLCHDCNTGIGKFKDNIELLQSAIDYLIKHNTD